MDKMNRDDLWIPFDQWNIFGLEELIEACTDRGPSYDIYSDSEEETPQYSFGMN